MRPEYENYFHKVPAVTSASLGWRHDRQTDERLLA